LKKEYHSLNPVSIQRKIVMLQDSLENMVIRKQRLKETTTKKRRCVRGYKDTTPAQRLNRTNP
jgi:hypothetical protein